MCGVAGRRCLFFLHQLAAQHLAHHRLRQRDSVRVSAEKAMSIGRGKPRCAGNSGSRPFSLRERFCELRLSWRMVAAVGFAILDLVSSLTLARPPINHNSSAFVSASMVAGSAVGDLQALDRNDDLYANFDVLDDLQVQDDVTATP